MNLRDHSVAIAQKLSLKWIDISELLSSIYWSVLRCAYPELDATMYLISTYITPIYLPHRPPMPSYEDSGYVEMTSSMSSIFADKVQFRDPGPLAQYGVLTIPEFVVFVTIWSFMGLNLPSLPIPPAPGTSSRR